MVASWRDLPAEVQFHIFADTDPSDLGRLARVSRSFNHLIKGNELLFKDVYLQYWDDPSQHPSKPQIGWEDSVKQACAITKITECKDPERRRSNLPELARSVTLLSSTAATNSSPASNYNIRFLERLLHTTDKPNDLLTQSSLYARARGHYIDHFSDRHAHSQQRASAKLHCLYGIPILQIEDEMRTYPYAASRVYDLRNYITANHWGPFLDDGSNRVDWEKVEAILLVLGHNIGRIDSDGESSLSKLWHSPFRGTVPYSYKPVGSYMKRTANLPFTLTFLALHKAPFCRVKPDPELEKQDPYGISGTWLRIVCFLDYRELHDFNFLTRPRLRSDPRPPLSTHEATRLIVMTLVVTGVTWPTASDPTDPEDKGAKMPIVSFTGNARALHAAWDPNANSQIRGTVSGTPEGEVRWTSVSVYPGGEERWKSEGIQVGGIKSARGVIGNWFDKDYSREGPVGPTAFWKIRDDVTSEDEDKEENGLGLGPNGLGAFGWFGADDDDDDDSDEDMEGMT